MKYKKLIIIGAGGYSKVIAEIAKLNGFKSISYLDDIESCNLKGYLGKISDYRNYIKNYMFFVAIGDNVTRKKIQQEITAKGAFIVNLIHPHAIISSNVKLGLGIAVMGGAVINSGATIGNGVIINTCSSIDHDCMIGDYVHISVGAHIAGTSRIGERCFICAGVTVINNIRICADCIVGAGAVVVKDIEKAGIYKGVPAKLK